MKSILFGCLLTIAGMLAASPVRAQAGNEEVRRVIADWKKRQEAVERIRYVVVGRSIVPKGRGTDDVTGKPLVPPVPAQDIEQKQDSTLLLDFPKQRFRLEMNQLLFDWSERRLFPRVSTTVFDGHSGATEMPREANTSAVHTPALSDYDIYINRNESRYHPLGAVSAYYLSPLLLAHGLVSQFMEQTHFGKLPDPSEFIIHGRHIHAGRPCLVLRTLTERSHHRETSFDEYWIDTARDSAVVRQSAYVNDKPLTDIEVTYQQTPHGWLPLRWTGTTRERGKRIINVTRLRVQEFIVDPPVADADFQPVVKPGMNILEDTYEDPEKVEGQPGPGYTRKIYHVGPDGRWNEVVNGAEQKSKRWLWYGVGIPLAAVSALLFWYARRRGRRSRPTPAPGT